MKSNVYRFRGDSTVTKVQLPKADKQTCKHILACARMCVYRQIIMQIPVKYVC